MCTSTSQIYPSKSQKHARLIFGNTSNQLHRIMSSFIAWTITQKQLKKIRVLPEDKCSQSRKRRKLDRSRWSGWTAYCTGAIEVQHSSSPSCFTAGLGYSLIYIVSLSRVLYSLSFLGILKSNKMKQMLR